MTETANQTMKQVLDKGYVRLVNAMGSDATVVNSARVSYDKQISELTDKDTRLIQFLAKHGHTSPFRHAMLQFEVYAPLMIARQWWKYVIGGDHQQDAWNESSRRYITEEPTFYIPNEWRSAPENSKQGSGAPLDTSDEWSRALIAHINSGVEMYEKAMEHGICAEQARLFLPAYGMYVRWYWTASLQSVVHLVSQRSKPDAQQEFQQYAQVVEQLARQAFPESFESLLFYS